MVTKKKVVLVALVLAGLAGVAYAGYWVYSNIVHVHVGLTSYTLTLYVEDADIVLGEKVSFYGYLKLGDTPVGGAIVHIYLTDASGNIIREIGNDTTRSWNGYFGLEWIPTEPGDYYFKAGYEVAG
jgi:hypothetical protein